MQPTVNIALRAARKAGDIIAQAADRVDLIRIEEKERNDFVTNIDRAAEEEIVSQIQRAFPDDNLLGEESGLIKGKNPQAETTWYIDPLDGTTNFIRGIPHFAVSIAAVTKGRIEHAVVYDPIRREEFTASRGRGAAINGRRLRVSKQGEFSGALIGTGIPYRASQQPLMQDYLKCVEHFAKEGSGIRRAGSASLDLAYVAAGRLDAFWEYALRPWDIAAGILLITEAGGLVSDFQGGETFFESGNVVCGNPKLFKELLKIVNKNLGSVT